MERASGRGQEGDINHLLDCTEFYIQKIKPNYLLLIGDGTRERRSLAARVTEQDRLARARFPHASRCSWSAYLREKGSGLMLGFSFSSVVQDAASRAVFPSRRRLDGDGGFQRTLRSGSPPWEMQRLCLSSGLRHCGLRITASSTCSSQPGAPD